ncbi:MAG: ABC transporter permease subunit [Candidatus Limnocylindria bacterium]
MIRRAWELFAVPSRAARRAGLVWGISLAILIVLTVAFWPSFRDQPELSDIVAGMPEPLIEAFGLADFNSPEGFLRGNLYAVLVPLLLAVAGVLLMNGQTASEEDSGRMESYLAQPVTRGGVFVGRALGVGLWLVVIGLFMLGAQLASNAAFDLEIGTDRIIATVALCVLLGAFHAGLAMLVAGATGRPGLVLAVGLAVAVAGYVAIALFPISDVLEPWRHASPWDWALGGDPLGSPTEWWRYAALGAPAVALAAAGTWAFGRRDVSAA